MTDDIELLIAGGGLNGLVLGIACSGAGLPCAVVDRQDPNAMLEAAFDGRSSALAYGSQQILEALGLWPAIAAQAEPILEIRVADDNAPLFLHYDHRELGTDAPLGWIVENRVLRCALIEHARSLPNLRLLAPLEVEAVEASEAGATATLSDGQPPHGSPCRCRRRRPFAIAPGRRDSRLSTGVTGRPQLLRQSAMSARTRGSPSSIFYRPALSQSYR